MLEYWMASNETGYNGTDEDIEGTLQNPGSASLFVGYPRWLLDFAAGSCILFMIIGIPGNLFTIIALFCTKKLKNATAVFIMNLSISDLMFCCFNLPLATSTFWHSSWRYGTLLCRLFPLLRYGLVAVSLFTILMITFNRYVMIGHPRVYPRLYKSNHLVPMVLGTWIIAFGFLIVTWFEKWGRFGLDPAIGSCSILPDVHGRSPKEFLFVVAFLIPCVAIAVCYARIFYVVRKTTFRSKRRDIVTDADDVEDNHERRSTLSRNQEDEVSFFGLSCAEDFLCTNLSPKRTTSHFNGEKDSQNSSKSAVEESSTECEPSSEQDAAKEVTVEGNHEKLKGRKIEKRCIDFDPKFEDCDQLKIELRKELEDIPYVDEYEDLDERELNSLNIDQNKPKEPIENSSANTRNKLETMENKSSFNVASVLWVQRIASPGNDKLEKTERFVDSRANTPEGSVKKKAIVFRRESKVKCMKKQRGSVTPPRMTTKDRKLLKMILVIFSAFLICYLPITITKTFKDLVDSRGLNIAGYLLIYMTTCINPVIYVVMSSEYRSAYKSVLLCRSDSVVMSKVKI